MNIKMPTREQFRLQMGELSPQEVRIAQAAYRLGAAEAIRAAVGGEAVDHVQVFEVADSERGDFHNNQCAWSSIGVYLPIGTKLYLHASPPATVDVGALPEPEGEMKWTRSAGVCIQPEPGYTAEQMREYRFSGGVSADALRQYISGLRLVQKVNENDGTERSNGKAFAFGVVANELAAMIGKEA